jgi:hypothetical protein
MNKTIQKQQHIFNNEEKKYVTELITDGNKITEESTRRAFKILESDFAMNKHVLTTAVSLHSVMTIDGDFINNCKKDLKDLAEIIFLSLMIDNNVFFSSKIKKEFFIPFINHEKHDCNEEKMLSEMFKKFTQFEKTRTYISKMFRENSDIKFISMHAAETFNKLMENKTSLIGKIDVIDIMLGLTTIYVSHFMNTNLVQRSRLNNAKN